MEKFKENTPYSTEVERFYIQSTVEGENVMVTILPMRKTDKVSWKYKRSAVKGFIRTIVGKHSWFGYVDYSKPYDITIQLVDKDTKEILCKARLHNDEKYLHVPLYSIIPIDKVAKEYYKS